MGKSILVIDTPKSCKECPCGSAEETMSLDFYCCCEVLDCQISEDKYDLEKPDWCPLQDIPEHKEVSDDPYCVGNPYDYGWNNCLDQIMNGG